MDIAQEICRACELRGETYSSAEIWELLGRGAAEIARLQREVQRLQARYINLENVVWRLTLASKRNPDHDWS